MPTVLVTGANRGLGLEFCRQYAADGWRVYAGCRNPGASPALSALAGEILPRRLDVSDHATIDALAEELGEQALDVLISNAGVYGDTPNHGLGRLDYAAWGDVFRINTMAAARLAECFTPALARAPRPVFAALTSLMGSMADNSSGDNYLYRSSKAALNAVLKSLALDLQPRGITVLILHPGWVRTDMGGPHALITPPQSVGALRSLIDGATPERSGRFLNYDGTDLPW